MKVRPQSASWALLLLLSFGAPQRLHAETLTDIVRHWRITHETEILREFTDLLSIPNVASDSIGIQRNAQALISMLESRHVPARLLSVPGAPPVVYGEIRTLNATHTVVFYAHYDGQPVTSSDWEGGRPFEPAIRTIGAERRLFARSASDDKAAIIAQLAALDALQAAKLSLHANIRFVWEGEEEAGSPHLAKILEENRNLVTGDVWLICDGPLDQSGLQTILFGGRGDSHLEVTVFGPRRELHSGHYGNWSPNPAMMLAQLLSGMKDADGYVLIPDFYKGVMPLTALELKAISEAPHNDEKIKEELWLGHVDGAGKNLIELLNEPSLNINGISSARTGPLANNVIPSNATVDLDLRVVKGLDWRQQQDRVIAFIRAQGYFVVEAEPTREILLTHPKVALVKRDHGYNAVRTPMEVEITKEVVRALETAHGYVIKFPTTGGSVPLEAIENAVHAHTLIIPIANYDNNQHSANENIRLQNLWDGIETFAALFEME